MGFNLKGLGTLIGGAGAANPAMLGLGAIGSIGQGIAGLLQAGKAKKMMKRLQDPGYKIPKEFAQNLAIAENMAQTGMPAEQYNKGQQDINRAGTAGFRALSRSSNPAAGAASLLRGQTDALNNLNVANASARRQNILGAMGARREFAGQKLAQQQYAQKQYADEYNQLNALRGAGIQNTIGGISSLGQLGLYSNIYGKVKEPETVDTTPTTASTTATPTTPNSSTFNISDPYGLNQLFNQYRGIGGIVGKKFGGN
jgi:hypothetical protein